MCEWPHRADPQYGGDVGLQVGAVGLQLLEAPVRLLESVRRTHRAQLRVRLQPITEVLRTNRRRGRHLYLPITAGEKWRTASTNRRLPNETMRRT